jgi:hypothetical protein
MKTETVKFRKDDGPVYLEVTSGHVTLGSFLLEYGKAGTYEYIEIDRDKKKIINDEEPDLFRIPVSLNELKNYRVYLVGRFRPAPDHNQIVVTYSFFQRDKLIHETKIEKVSDQTVERFSHRFKFEEKEQ